MDLWINFAVSVGGLVAGWLLREWWVVGRLERQMLKNSAETQAIVKELAESDSLLAASSALSDLDLLARLEEQRYGDVNTLLIHKLGLFYHRWNSDPKGAARSADIRNALAQIREASKEFKSVEAVLNYRPPEDGVTL
jgi:hypothetical protein